MIEPDSWIRENAEELGVREENINPASVDVCLGGHIVEFYNGQLEKRFELTPGEEFKFIKNALYICHTQEYTKCPKTHAWMMILKSSAGRRGLDHAHSGWGDPGFEGQVTFEFCCNNEVDFKIGDRIAQLVYMRLTKEPDRAYGETGRYQGQTGAALARDEKKPECPLLDDSSTKTRHQRGDVASLCG